MRTLIFAFCICSTSAVAQQSARPNDQMLDVTTLAESLSGNTIEFFDTSLASYFEDGRYEYRYRPDDFVWEGKYELRDGSMVCTTFSGGAERCDMIVRANDRLVMIIENGDRYPVKSVKPIN